MSFNEINPETSKPWTRAELYSELEKVKEAKNDGAAYAIVSAGLPVDSDIISWPEQAANLRARWAIHLDEFDIAIKDLKTLYKAIEVFVENQREYWTNQPLLKKQG